MCCFSRNVESVSDTLIFARRKGDQDRQYLVYSMTIRASEDLAMILPIPVPPDSPDDAVRFINLENYPRFFNDLRAGFPRPPATGGRALRSQTDSKKKLEVVQVGSFEASFVPSTDDFQRLDARFRLPAETWDQLPQYAEYGFAVFKLKQGANKIHPMAFEFPTAMQGKLFFPTVHIHDGQVHGTAKFDHELYGQLDGLQAFLPHDWEESPQPAGLFMKRDLAGELIDPQAHVYRRRLTGNLKNEDIWI